MYSPGRDRRIGHSSYAEREKEGGGVSHVARLVQVVHLGKLSQFEGVVALVANSAVDTLPHVGNDVLQPLLPHLHARVDLKKSPRNEEPTWHSENRCPRSTL